jgi:hypothetical protein
MTEPLADYYHWEETDKGIRIYMHAGMADRLQAAVLESTEEVGGILLGHAEDGRGGAVTFIDDFVPVPCSYRGGLLYGLSDNDNVKLESALLRIALAGCETPGAPSVLGYYRSHMRDGMSLSAADLLVIDSYFQAPVNVFLLLKAVTGAKACTAGFFFWEDGRVQPEFSSLEVALGRTAPAPGPPVDVPDPVEDDDAELPADLAELFHKAALPEPSGAVLPAPPLPPLFTGQTTHSWRGLALRAATILIATTALVISVMTYLSASHARPEAATAPASASMLGLRVERNPPDLLVTWNRNAREIVAARRATLSIRDGRFKKELDLKKADLAGGSFLYTPANDDIQFRLEVYGADDGSVAQSIRVSTGTPK